MNWYLYSLICGVIGAIIGALTNDIAIRCIFRFLIPRKKAQIAEAVQNVVSRELMAPEKVAVKIRSERVRNSIQNNLRSMLDRFLDSELPSVNSIMSEHPDTIDSISEQLLGVIIEEFTARTENRLFFKKTLQPLVLQELEDILSRQPAELVPALDSVVDTLPERIISFLSSDTCRIRTTSVVLNMLRPALKSPRRLYEILPQNINSDIASLFKSQAPAIAGRIALFLETEENQERIRNKINEALEEYFKRATPEMLKSVNKKLGGVFKINPGSIIRKALGIDKEIENICRTLPDRIRFGRGKDDILNNLENIIEHLIDDFMQYRLKDLCADVDEAKLQDYLSAIYSQLLTPEIVRQTANDLQELVRNSMDRSIISTVDRLKIQIDLDDIADMIVQRLRLSLRSKTFLNIASKRLGEAIDKLRNRKIGSLASHIPDKSRQRLVFIAGDIVSETITSRIEDFSNESGIWDIITESIENYDNREIEGLVRKIANRELQWVTYLGGLIGFVIGALQGLVILWFSGFE